MSEGSDGRAVVLVSHGTVDDLDDLPAFVTNVRRGRPAPPEVLAELRRRYEAIGGQSPLNAINAALARKLSVVLGVPVRLANRLWRPTVKDVLAGLAREGVTRVAVVPLAQHSAHVYARDAQSAAEGTGVALACAPGWGQRADLCEAFVKRIRKCLEGLDPASTHVLMTAHSLPTAVIQQGDPYERDVRAAAAAIGAALAPDSWTVAFQSQGMDGGDWLGPDLPTALDEARDRGAKTVVLAPIGFLADHVEILYDLDIEAAALASARGLRTVRAGSLDADDDLVAVIADVARPLLDAHG
jgi:protoporphyrin/coproporphyrin ferrochelatase